MVIERELPPEHQVIAEQSRLRIMNYIAGLIVHQQVERPMFDIGLDDEQIS